MNLKISTLLLCIFLIVTLTNVSHPHVAAAYCDFSCVFAKIESEINRSERVDHWTCYDYSVDFAKNNPDFGVVTVSRSPEFEGISHMTNYHFYDNETMIVYDGLLDKLYFIHNLQWDVEDYNYYYFWIDETPTRECVDMIDNRDVVI